LTERNEQDVGTPIGELLEEVGKATRLRHVVITVKPNVVGPHRAVDGEKVPVVPDVALVLPVREPGARPQHLPHQVAGDEVVGVVGDEQRYPLREPVALDLLGHRLDQAPNRFGPVAGRYTYGQCRAGHR
jgi:hypothetical protein